MIQAVKTTARGLYSDLVPMRTVLIPMACTRAKHSRDFKFLAKKKAFLKKLKISRVSTSP